MGSSANKSLKKQRYQKKKKNNNKYEYTANTIP